MISIRFFIAFLLLGLFFSNSACASESVKSAHLSAQQELSKLQALANSGDVNAQLELAAMYYGGQGAMKSDAMFKSNLGLMYSLGKGVPQNYAEAWRWRHHPDEKNPVIAKSNLDVMYSLGKGVPQNYAEAWRWRHEHQGVQQNYAQALKWALIAKSEGDHDAIRDVSLIEDKATPAQIAIGRSMARQWESDHLQN